MNDFSDLENELKQLRPAVTSPELITRVERRLTETPVAVVPRPNWREMLRHFWGGGQSNDGALPSTRRVTVNWFALGSGLAAATVILVFARTNVDRTAASKQTRVASATPIQQTAPADRSFVPDGMTRVVFNTSNEGLVYPGNGSEPSRRVRSRSRETMQWKDPSSGASLRVSYPTEDVELIPVSISAQ